MNRRQLLKGALAGACGAMGHATFVSGAATLLATGRAATDTSGYKALVCVLLAGGNDSFNMLVRRDQQGYGEYAGIRSDLALPRDALLLLDGAGSGENAGMEFGVHPGMPEIQRLYNAGKAAFVANVGTLVERVTGDGSRVPLQLFSHDDQIDQWQTSLPDQRSQTGWGGRLADLIADTNGMQTVSSSISVSGNNLFQSGRVTSEFSMNPSGGIEVMEGYRREGLFGQAITSGVDNLLQAPYANLFQRAYAEQFRQSLDAKTAFRDALLAAPTLSTQFSTNQVSQGFKAVATAIAARGALGQSRQTFFLVFGGWDHHDEVLQAQAGMLPVLSKGLDEFYQATQELGVAEDVTTFTISDFARTLTSNGRGSDHAWGGHQLVVGGAVRGGKVYGAFPEVYANNPLDLGRGRLIPTMATDEYGAELARWFGVAASELPTVFPNITRFYDIRSAAAPVGFLI